MISFIQGLRGFANLGMVSDVIWPAWQTRKILE